MTDELLGAETEGQRQRLLNLRSLLRRERGTKPTPAVDHALRLAELHVQIALGYTGHTEDLFPEEFVVS